MIRNPVLPGFNPDPSIVRADEKYVVATSTFEWFPGVRFHTSDDLVTWQPAGFALTDPLGLDLRGIPDSGGIWAPSLYFHEGAYRLLFTIVRTLGQTKDVDNYITSAPALDGPWSRPVYVGSRGFDASLFHAPDGRLYLLGLRWDHRIGNPGFGGIQIQELHPATFERLGSARVVHTSTELIEGPNMYYRDGWYYLLLAEGGTGWNHGIRLARSRNLWGPYEEDPVPVLTTRDLDPLEVARRGEAGPSGGLHKAGHGELVTTPDGEWYLVHLASRPLEAAEGAVCPLGRETCLQRVSWTEEGWLRLAHGGHLPALTVRAPAALSDHATAVPAVADEVLSPQTLGKGWQTLRVPADESWMQWSTNHGRSFRLTGRESLRSTHTQSLVARPLTSVFARLRATVDAVPAEPAHQAGVVAYYDTTSHVFWHLTASDKGRRLLAMERRNATSASRIVLDFDPGPAGPVHLEIAFERSSFRAFASLDGSSWTPLGLPVDISELSDDHAGLLRFTGAFAGVATIDVAEHAWTAEFSDVSLATSEPQRTDSHHPPLVAAPAGKAFNRQPLAPERQHRVSDSSPWYQPRLAHTPANKDTQLPNGQT